jgi:hypothetical protein
LYRFLGIEKHCLVVMWKPLGSRQWGASQFSFQAGPTGSLVIRELGTPLEITLREGATTVPLKPYAQSANSSRATANSPQRGRNQLAEIGLLPGEGFRLLDFANPEAILRSAIFIFSLPGPTIAAGGNGPLNKNTQSVKDWVIGLS